MESKSRLRGPNFSSSDNLLLCDIISKYKHFIENKRSDGATLLQKQKAWQEVTKEFNAIATGYHRTLESLQQNYKNLKKKAKKSTSDVKMEIPGTPVKRKLEIDEVEKSPVSEKFKVLEEENMEYISNSSPTSRRKDEVTSRSHYISVQTEILKIQLLEEQEKLEHNRLLRSMELEDAKAKYAHNEKLRKMELEKNI